MWPLAPSSILWLLLPLAFGLAAGWAAWRGRGSVFQVRARRRRRRTLHWRATEPRLPDAPSAAAPRPEPGREARIGTVVPEDDLTLVRGLGAAQARKLRALGITRFAQIAAWSPAQAELYAARLGDLVGRPEREKWREQARLLAEGDLAGLAARFGTPGQARI
jgi:predicted flap endonuclease-1-like 5' DNA nuclease